MHPVLREILQDIDRLEPFPEVASKVLELTLQDDLNDAEMIRELVGVVRTDLGVTAKVLKLANSAAFGTGQEIATLQEAGVRLGRESLVRLVMTSTAACFFMGLGSSSARSNRSLWEESVSNAVSARLVARRCGYEDHELAYTVGLVQNMGHVVMDRFLVQERDEILGRLDDGCTALEAEEEVLGMSHAELGARMARRWNFPSVLVDAIRNHHVPGRSQRDRELCATTSLAEALTWWLLGEEDTRALCYGVSGRTVESMELSRAELAELVSELPTELERTRDLIGID